MKIIHVSKILILFVCFQIQAQESENPTVFKYEKTDEKIPLSGYKSVLNSSVFIKNENSAASNYSLVYDYIKSKYDYPEDVILSSSEPESIVIQETIKDLLTFVSLGFTHNSDVKYNMSFETSDNVIKCTVSNMRSIIKSGYEMEEKWTDMGNALFLHKRNGKPKKSMIGITDIKIENHLNKIVTALK